MDNSPASPPTPRRLSRLGLVIWLLLPLVVVGLLWLSIDRSQGRADPDRWRNVPAGPGSASDRGLAPEPAPASGRAEGDAGLE